MLNVFRKLKSGFTLIELMVVIVIVAILALAIVPLFRKEVEKARFTEGVTALGAMQTKIKVAQQLLGELPGKAGVEDTDFNTVPGLVRLVSDGTTPNSFSTASYGTVLAAGPKGRSTAQEQMGVGYDEYTGKYFKNENYQYRLLHQVDANGDYAYAVAVVGTTNTASKVGSAYAIWVSNWNAAPAGTDKFVTATYGDEGADDSQTVRMLAADGNSGGNNNELNYAGKIEVPSPYNLRDAGIDEVTVGADGGRWMY